MYRRDLNGCCRINSQLLPPKVIPAFLTPCELLGDHYLSWASLSGPHVPRQSAHDSAPTILSKVPGIVSELASLIGGARTYAVLFPSSCLFEMFRLGERAGELVIKSAFHGTGLSKEKLLPGLLLEEPPSSTFLSSIRSAVFAEVARVTRTEGVSTAGSFIRILYDVEAMLSEHLVHASHNRVLLLSGRDGGFFRRIEMLGNRRSSTLSKAVAYPDLSFEALKTCTHFHQEVPMLFTPEKKGNNALEMAIIFTSLLFDSCPTVTHEAIAPGSLQYTLLSAFADDPFETFSAQLLSSEYASYCIPEKLEHIVTQQVLQDVAIQDLGIALALSCAVLTWRLAPSVQAAAERVPAAEAYDILCTALRFIKGNFLGSFWALSSLLREWYKSYGSMLMKNALLRSGFTRVDGRGSEMPNSVLEAFGRTGPGKRSLIVELEWVAGYSVRQNSTSVRSLDSTVIDTIASLMHDHLPSPHPSPLLRPQRDLVDHIPQYAVLDRAIESSSTRAADTIFQASIEGMNASVLGRAEMDRVTRDYQITKDSWSSSLERLVGTLKQASGLDVSFVTRAGAGYTLVPIERVQTEVLAIVSPVFTVQKAFEMSAEGGIEDGRFRDQVEMAASVLIQSVFNPDFT